MTIRALATGPLWKAPEQRTAKNGNPFVTATIKVRGGRAMGQAAGGSLKPRKTN